jgi:rubrerythrin
MEVIDVLPIEPAGVKRFEDDLEDLEQDCPTCGDVGYLAIAGRDDDAEPCPNCNPEAGNFTIINPAQRRREFEAWAERN